MKSLASRCVVKVGGSLFDLPHFGRRLQSFLAELKPRGVILVPGGGPAADLVRVWDRDLHLGEEKAHWLALRALAFNAHLLAGLLAEARVVDQLDEGGPESDAISILDMHGWALADETSADHLPHSWNVTSDSLSARVALKTGAAELILLKSTGFLGQDWRQAAAVGIVDPHFPEIIARAAPALRVRIVDFRDC